MHFTVLSASIALALAGVRAQLPPQVTPCIETCLAQAAAEDLDGCSVTDVQCLCANKKIQQDVFSCLQQQCSTQEFEEVQVFVAAECAPPASSTSTLARATSSTMTTHSEAPSTTHPASSSEERTSERTGTVSTTTAPATHLTSTTSANATSLANSTSLLLSIASTAPVALSTSSTSLSTSSETSTSTMASSAPPTRTNAAQRVGPGAVGVLRLVLGAVLGGTAVW